MGKEVYEIGVKEKESGATLVKNGHWTQIEALVKPTGGRLCQRADNFTDSNHSTWTLLEWDID